MENQIKEKRTFEAISSGAVYKLPKYKVVPNIGLEKAAGSVLIPFVRGSKLAEEKEILSVEGVVHESLLSMMIYDLEVKQHEVPNKITPLVIQYLEAARDLLESRQRERISRDVQGTYKK